ncbi:MAG TPA: NADH-quinone oxidoreductase subunit L [Planctomycetaceae bacterium]|nr:NADH-quinone oxidoreductase subunit L [Planctomycetaceae bacterium]
MLDWLIRLIPLFPLIACLTTLVLGARVLREKSHWPAILGCGLSAICSLALVFCVNSREIIPQPVRTVPIYRWFEVASREHHAGNSVDQTARKATDDAGRLPDNAAWDRSLEVTIALRVDSLSATMLAMLTFVATLVAIYAAGYMHGDRGYWRFFTEVSLFVFSMIMLVLSANFLELYVFWEAVGLCSYLLVGFWYERPAAAAAGKKAFVVNRIGDFGFAVGVFLIWTTFGSLDFEKVLSPAAIAEVGAKNPAMIGWICMCLFLGAVGKSAQFPLHVWLPDAMEGPTPVSALIHAATMVTAGVYLVARATPLFAAAPEAQMVVAFIGGFTALLAALIALTQNDLKRVLAYSTVSQLGYMFLGLGTGLMTGISAAMFHLVTHAFFKALLFLGAGSVMHAMGGVIDMRRFGGLKTKMPHTYWTFLIGALALAGFPLLSGFWSKDAILSAVHEAGHHSASTPHSSAAADLPESSSTAGDTDSAHSEQGPRLLGMCRPCLYELLLWMASITALLTAFYTFRAFFMTFHGPEKIPPEAGHHAHESPSVMCIPLWVLAGGALALGAALDQHTTGMFGRFLDWAIPGVYPAQQEEHVNAFIMGLSTLLALAGIAAAYLMYGTASTLPARLAALAGPLTRLSQNKFYLDEVYSALIVWPLKALANLSRFLDWALIDGLIVGGIGKLPGLVGRLPRPIQNGLVQFYALAMTLALGVLLWVLLTK